ncbi:unnamed protein product [Adineta steineri]|uniref:CBM-cenC domain-containing protein n=1 Tax=Adineta steineri TaxID=433720 RepID=A0A815G8G5_9BILA|nr:unnamed protein product [Adineta steineri]CAF4180976.1 unnamed protein product [Adineta steineri]
MTTSTTKTTSSTMTTSTTMTSSTMTTSTAMTTSKTTTTATVSNVCTGGEVYTTQLLYLTLTATLPWKKCSFNYTAPNITSATIIFSLRNDPLDWYLDDITITDSSGIELLSNGDFELGDLTSWTYCNPNNAAHAGFVGSSTPHNGYYSYVDGSVNASDYLSQKFTVAPYNNYSVKFWLSANSDKSSFALVSITS